MRFFNRLADWMSKRGLVVTWFCGGVLLGILICYPAGWLLPDSIANLLGGIIGAVATIGSALWMWNEQGRRLQKKLGSLIVSICSPAMNELMTLHQAARNYLNSDIPEPIFVHAASEKLRTSREQLTRLNSSWSGLSTEQLDTLIKIENELEAAARAIESMQGTNDRNARARIEMRLPEIETSYALFAKYLKSIES